MGDEPLYAPLVRKLRNGRDDLRSQVVTIVVNQSAAMRAAPADDVILGVGLVIAPLVKLLSGQALSTTDRAQLSRTAQRWAAAGIDARAQASAVATASEAVHRVVLQAADSHRFAKARDRRVAGEQVGAALLHAASTVHQALAGNAIEANGVRRSSATLVDRILDAAPEQWPVVEAEAAEAGLSGLFGLLVVVPDADASPNAGQKVAASVAGRDDGLCGSVQAEPIPHVPVVVKTAGDGAWRLVLKHAEVDAADSGCELVAAPAPVPLTKLPLTYATCRATLPYTAVLPSRSPLVATAELQALGLLAAAPLLVRHEVFQVIVGGLLGRPDLLHLLDGLVAIGPYAKVESVLDKPIRTITDAVGSIKRKTGLDWNEPRDRYLLTLAVHLRWLAAMSLGEFDENVWGPIPNFAALRSA